MVRGVNKVILLGNTAAEPDFRVLSNGTTSVATVGLATNESYKDQNGNTQEQTEWHRLVFWGRLAEIARDYMRKGSQVYVEGKIKTRSFDDQQGVKRYSTEIHVTELHLLSQKSAGNGASDAADAQGYPPQGGFQNQNAYPQGGYPQAPAYQQQPAYGSLGSYQQPQQGNYRNNPGYQQRGGNAPQGSFRGAAPAGAVPVMDSPAQAPAGSQSPAAPAQGGQWYPQQAAAPATPAAYQQAAAAAVASAQATPAAFQTAAPAAPQAQGADRPFKDDDLPF